MGREHATLFFVNSGMALRTYNSKVVGAIVMGVPVPVMNLTGPLRHSLPAVLTPPAPAPHELVLFLLVHTRPPISRSVNSALRRTHMDGAGLRTSN